MDIKKILAELKQKTQKLNKLIRNAETSLIEKEERENIHRLKKEISS